MRGASQKREQDRPLSLAARLGLYAMLAGLVLASFTVTPGRRPAVVATPVVDEPSDERITPLSRGIVRGLRYYEDPDPTLAPSPAVPDATTKPVVAIEREPEATPDPTPEPTRPPTPRPASRPAPVVANTTTALAEAHMLELINASRTLGGLVPLSMDIAVADVARLHSGAEAQVLYVYHDGPDGTAHSRDVPACGTGWYGENTGKIWNDNVDALHREFMAEPWVPINHRTNIMDPAFRRVGIGAVIGPDAMYMTMVFCR